MQTLLRTVAALVVVATLAPLALAGDDEPVAPPRYRVQALGVLSGDRYSEATAISEDGTVVGWSARGTGDDGPRQAFIYRDGRMHTLGTLGGGYTEALGVNDRGDVIGQSRDAQGQLRPFLWRDGRMQDLAAALGTGEGRALGLNAAGQVVGEFDNRAFIHDASGSRYLEVGGRSFASAINDHGVVTGGTVPRGEWRTFVFEAGRTTLLPNPPDHEEWGDFYGQDINNAGQVQVNRPWTADHTAASYIYTDGHYQSTYFGNSGAWDMNNHGWVVGSVSTFDPEWGDYFWEPALHRDGGAYALGELLRPADAARWELSEARGINDAGVIVGSGWFNGRYQAYIATPVPEPAGAALLLAGLGVVGAATRRRGAGSGG